MHRRSSVLVAVLLLTGCTVSPPTFVEPDLGFEVPDGWAAPRADGGIVGDRWWREFGDERLAELIEEALASNHDLSEAAARVETAFAEASKAGAALHPTLDATGNALRQRQNFAAFPIPGVGDEAFSPTSNAFGVALNIQWELDLWGRLRAGARAAAAELQSEQAAFRAAALSLAVQTARAWFAVTEARQQVDLAERTVDSYHRSRMQAAQRADAGVLAPLDEHLSEADLASAEADLRARREVFARSRRQLEILLGRYPAGLVDGAAELPAVSSTVPAGIPADVVRRRPDVARLERRLASALERVDAAKAALYPRLSLTGSAGGSSAALEDLVSGDFFVWSIAGGLIQPLFDGGRLRVEVAAAEGRVHGAASAFAQGVLAAFFEVEAALAAEDLLQGRETALRRAANAARAAAAVAAHRYEQGVEPLLVLLESKRRALAAESSLLAHRRVRLDNRLDLYLALGGGFEALPGPHMAARAEAGATR